RSCSICRNLRPSAWKVLMVSACATSALTSLPTRSRISRAALLVKVIAAILAGARCLRDTRYAIFCVITEVLPEPAPASTSSGLSQCSTAACCCGLSMGMEVERERTPIITGRLCGAAKGRCGPISASAAPHRGRMSALEQRHRRIDRRSESQSASPYLYGALEDYSQPAARL